jgi:hypothetical protein
MSATSALATAEPRLYEVASDHHASSRLVPDSAWWSGHRPVREFTGRVESARLRHLCAVPSQSFWRPQALAIAH